MKLNKNGIELMHHFEGCKLTAYLCPANVATIGWGNTFYESGRKVKIGESISQERADRLFEWVAESFSVQVRQLVKVQLTENQFSALVCFAYNVGVNNLRSSTLIKKVNVNPNDTEIFTEFLKWNKGGGKVLTGLVKRRQAEANLYYLK